MTRTILSFCGALAATATIVAAQTPPPAQPGTEQPTTTSGSTQALADRSAPTVTLNGCVARWQGNSAGATASDTTTPSSTGMQQFILSNLEPTSTTSATSSTTSSLPSSVATGYLLKPGPSVDLSQHVNHRVQVTGTLDAAGKATSTYGATQSGQTPGSMTMQTFHVTSVKMLSSSCP